MTRIVIRVLIWSEWNKHHITKHHVTVEEVEIATLHFLAHKHGYKGRYIILGRSNKRILAIIVKREKTSIYRVITARDADKNERRKVYEKEKIK